MGYRTRIYVWQKEGAKPSIMDAISCIIDHTNLTYQEVRHMLQQVIEGQKITLIPRESNVDIGVKLVQALERLDYAVDLKIYPEGKLTFLVNEHGKIANSAQKKLIPLSLSETEQIIYKHDIALVIVYSGAYLEWPVWQERIRLWQQEIKPNLVEMGEATHNNYPIYTPYKWITEADEIFLYIQQYH